MKRIILLVLSITILLVSCAQETQDADNVVVKQSDMWRVEFIEAEIAESLTASIAALTYSGDLQETEAQIVPGSGNVFLLLHLTIEKIGTGKAVFSWDDAYVEDNKGNVFFRMENDTFLQNLNIPRMKRTDIVFGSDTGYVCFEIPMESSGLRFVADNGNIIIAVAI